MINDDCNERCFAGDGDGERLMESRRQIPKCCGRMSERRKRIDVNFNKAAGGCKSPDANGVPSKLESATEGDHTGKSGEATWSQAIRESLVENV